MTALYIISPPQINLDSFSKTLDSALAGNEVGAFQLRLKDTKINEIEEAIKALLPICHKHAVPFFINDHHQLAKKYDVDGIHIGQKDGNIKELREIFGKDKIIGVSCQNSKHNAVVAAERGADYVSFGAFFPTKTKLDTTKADIEILKWWSTNTTIPCAAIGGINKDNIKEIANAGADFICLISEIWNAESPNEMIKQLNEIIKK